MYLQSSPALQPSDIRIILGSCPGLEVKLLLEHPSSSKLNLDVLHIYPPAQ